MSVLTTDAPNPDHAEPSESAAGIHLGWAVAGLSAAAGAIHFAMVPGHAGGSLVDPIGFAVVGWFQLLVAAAIIADRAGRNLYRVAVLGNLAVLGLWIWSRTAGLPVGSHKNVAEEWGTVDGITAVLEVGLILLAVRILLAPASQRVAAGRVFPVLAAVAALGLATTAITSTDAAEHGGEGHAHGEDEVATAAGHDSLMQEIDATRCDRQFNPPAYWEETAYLGIDTYQGGAMSAADHGGGDTGGHGHGGAAATTTTTDPDPTGGRGSKGLDDLITFTDKAGSGAEVDAAVLVSELGEASDEDYAAWLWWLRNTGTVGGSHEHASAAAPDDAGGHGGHVGPQPWIAMTDPEQCDQLSEELDLARETALSYPTPADAEAAGWSRVTGYVPGIAAHYMNFGHLDGEFAVDEPEMLLYDGDGPDASIVGLSYYIIHEGDAEPSQGFTGPNDHFHRHIGLCMKGAMVIGDSSTTAEECAARGGTKSENGSGWMNHVWIVPGCESPWGMFSGATPVLDGTISETSGEDGGACAGSGVRERYGLDESLELEPVSTAGG